MSVYDSDDDPEDTWTLSSKVLICTFDPWHTVQRFEKRLAQLASGKRDKKLGSDTVICVMSDGAPLCAECNMVMERVLVPRGATRITAPRLVAENFAEAIRRTREAGSQ